MTRLGRHRAFALALGTLLAVLALGAALYLAFGHELIARAHEGRSLGLLNRAYAGPPRRPLAFHLQRADENFAATVACALASCALAVILYVLVRSRARWYAWVLALPAFWVGVELGVAPRLVRHLRLIQYNIVQDPDHRPPKPAQPEPGWNSDAIRATPESEEFRSEDLSLVFLGDSFTYGMRVQAHQTFAKKVEQRLDARLGGQTVRVANFGWTSSSPLLSFRRLVDEGEAYRPDLVALFVDMTDFHDDVKWEGMLERRGIYWFHDKLPLTLRLLETYTPGLYWSWWRRSNGGCPRERYFVTERPLADTRAWMEPLAENVGKIAEWCDERDVAFALFVLPRYHQYSDVECPDDYELAMPGRAHSVLGPHVLEPFRFFDELRDAVDHPVYSLLEDFRAAEGSPHCFPDDPHWNDAGHTIAAEAIARDLEALIRARGLADG